MENLTLKRPAVSQSRKAKAQANIKRSDWRPACTKGTFLPRSVLCAGGDAPQCLCEAWIQLKQCVLRGGCASGKLPFSLFWSEKNYRFGRLWQQLITTNIYDLARWWPLVAIVNYSSKGGSQTRNKGDKNSIWRRLRINDWLKQAQDFRSGDSCSCPVDCQQSVSKLTSPAYITEVTYIM